jgi:hypothetical protein
MLYPIGQLSVGQILDNSFRLLTDKWRLLFGIGALLYAPILVLQSIAILMLTDQPQAGASQEEVMAAALESGGVVMIISLAVTVIYLFICGPLLSASITYAVSKEYLGQRATVRESIRIAFSKLLPVMWTGLLAGILIMLGFICLIIPGILLAFRYYLAQQVVVLEHESGSRALKRSGELMKGSYGIAFVLGFVIWTASALMGGIAAAIPILIVSQLITIILQTAATVLWSIAAVVLYFHCRSKVENYDLQLLAESVGEEDPADNPVPPPLPAVQ